MDNNQLPQSTEDKKKIEKVANGSRTKKSGARTLKDIFISEDVANVKSYVLMDILVPTIKKAVSDIVTNAVDMILYGESGHSRKRPNASKVSYREYYDRRQEERAQPRVRSTYDYDDILFDNRGEAEAVLDLLCEQIETYGMVSVADLYEAVGETGTFTDNKYGWTNLRGTEVRRERNGYVIKLPRVIPLK